MTLGAFGAKGQSRVYMLFEPGSMFFSGHTLHFFMPEQENIEKRLKRQPSVVNNEKFIDRTIFDVGRT